MIAAAQKVEAYSVADFRRRALVEGTPFGPDDYGDHRLNPLFRDDIFAQPLRDAAVMIAAIDHPAGATVILTKRTDRLRSHSGQIAFPGGRIDPEDVSPEAAALRETEEEIGLLPASIEVIGRLPDYSTGSGYRIAPVLGIVRPPVELHLNPDEVDAAFEVPLSFLMDPANHTQNSLVWKNGTRFFYDMPFEDRRIWGVTAGIVRTLYERLYA